MEENTPFEEDIALDPELLGLVFENLLAELDPNLEENTRKSIRKLTGSYYTPRNIIHEMVNDSLFIYLKKHIAAEKIPLLSDLIYKDEYNANDNDFCKSIVSAIDRFKVLDPACGSGAFPMGVLHKLVAILKLIDKQNEKWIELKLQSVDSNYRDEFKKTLMLHQDDYSRKLGIIRDSIYGIDIQPLAVQITKLRFFISLLCDQKNENGITPMPNIETKIICADSLKNLQPDVFAKNAIEQLTEARRKYYQPGISPKEKEDIADKIVDVLTDAFPSFAKEMGLKGIQNKEKIREWFTHATVAAPFFNMDFFYPELKEQKGFDCVIGNPPYGGTDIKDDVRETLFGKIKSTIQGSKDPYGAFIARFLSDANRPVTPLKDGGVLAFIVSDTFMTIKSHKPLRKLMMANYIHKMIRVHPDTFRATVNTAIIVCERSSAKELDKAHICEMADMTNISIHDNYARFTEILRQTEGVAFGEIKKSISNSEYAIYYYPQQLIKTNSNLPFFVASPKLFALMNDGNDPQNKPKTTLKTIDNKQVSVRTIELNEKKIEVVKLGDIADVKVGLQTGDNDAYLFQNPNARGTYRDINDYTEFVLTDGDLEKIRNNEELRHAVIEKGISKDDSKSERWFDGRYIVPYDKGGESDSKGGWLPNYFVVAQYYIDWSEQCATALVNAICLFPTSTKPYPRNTDYYFLRGISFSDTGEYSPTYRLNFGSVFDQKGSNIIPRNINVKILLHILGSKLSRFIVRTLINHTVSSHVDCQKEIPIYYTNDTNGMVITLINKIIETQKSNPRYDYASHEQIEIDKLVYEAYGLSPEDVEEVENWYARRYPRLSQAQKQNLRNLGKSDDYLVLYGYKKEGK
ncbi:MAG: N-6 DNA methylase [Prevotella sp.]|nr:N-6 DNA methylase [Prevotella sp.]